jgi:threonine aldolase
MRQTGILAACAAYALTYNFPQLRRVHALAKKLERGLKVIGVEVVSSVETCMARQFQHFSRLYSHIITPIGVLRSGPSWTQRS